MCMGDPDRVRKYEVDRPYSSMDILSVCSKYGADFPIIIRGMNTSIRELAASGWSMRIRTKFRYTTGTKVVFSKDGCVLSLRLAPRFVEEPLGDILSHISHQGFRNSEVKLQKFVFSEDRRVNKVDPIIEEFVMPCALTPDMKAEIGRMAALGKAYRGVPQEMLQRLAGEAAVRIAKDATGLDGAIVRSDDWKFDLPVLTEEMHDEIVKMQTLKESYTSSTHQPLLNEYSELQLLQELERRADARPKRKKAKITPDNVICLLERLKSKVGETDDGTDDNTAEQVA